MCFGRILSLLMLLILVLAVAGTSSSTVWVAPTEGECQGRAPCGTLQGLWLSKTGVNVINESNTTWVFLPGLHSLNATAGSLILFWHVSDLILTGDELCVRKIEECTIVCANYLCIFLFIESRDVTVQHISVTYSNTTYLPLLRYFKWDVSHLLSPFCRQLWLSSGNMTVMCTESSFNVSVTSWMFVWSVNVHLYSFNLVGYNSEITVYNPREQFEAIGCHFSQLPPATDQKIPRHSLALLISPSSKVAESVHVLVSGCTYEAQQYFPYVSPSSGITYYNHHAVLVQITDNKSELQMVSLCTVFRVNVTVDSCTFLRTSGVNVQFTDSPVLLATVRIMNSLLHGMASRKRFRVWEFKHLEGSGVKLQLLAGHWDMIQSVSSRNASCQIMFSRIHVSGNIFQNLASIEGIGVSLQTIFTTRHHLCNCKVPVVIENNNFIRNWGLRYASIIDATQIWPNGSSIYSDCEHGPFVHPALLLRNNSFFLSIAEFSRCLGIYTIPGPLDNGESVLGIRWNIFQDCTVGDPSKGVVHLSGFMGSFFAALMDNNITRNVARGLSVINSQVLFNGSNTLSSNYAPYGGGIFLDGRSQMLLTNGTQLSLLRNVAAFTGGGIFVPLNEVQLEYTPSSLALPTLCFFDLVAADGQLARNITSTTDLNVNVTLLQNRATFSGSSLFVSRITPCFHRGFLQAESEFFMKVFHLPSYSDEQEISCLPLQICSCNSSGPISCSLSRLAPVLVFPGQRLDLWLLVMGDLDIFLSTDLTLFVSKVSLPHFNVILIKGAPLKHTTRLSSSCNKVTIARELLVKLAAGAYFISFSYPALDNTPFESHKLRLVTSINMTVLDHCPHGYSMNNTGPRPLCACHSALQDRHISCSLDTLSFILPPRFWIGNGSENGSILFSAYCMPAYCRGVYESKEVFLSNLTHQCLHGRVGTLCGKCPEGQSVMLGSYNCETCSSYGIFVVAVYLVAGPLVIVFICFFNWTVSARSSNGLLLYLNIISINSDLLSSNSFAFVVISLLNFQVGIEMCLFDGMDEFAKTILSFGFPLYLLSLVAVIIMVSKCINMHRINKLIGPRITPVLATVIFLSYSMLSDSVLKSLLFARVCSTNGGCTPVWLLDGSLEYFRSIKHLILACIAVVILFGLLIPITLIALIGDLFRRCISNRWYMNFLDTFHSSYCFRWGFWMGVRVLLRVALLLLKVTVKPEVLWLVTACFSLSLAAVQSVLKPFRHLRFERFSHRLVDEWCSSEENGRIAANYLDISFLVNLTALFVCISYLPESAEVFISLSLCVALIELFLILAYHLVEYSPLWPPLLRATTQAVERMRVFVESMRHTEERQQGEDDSNHVLRNLPLVLRAEDCNDEDYESSNEETEDTSEEVEEAEQGLILTNQSK